MGLTATDRGMEKHPAGPSSTPSGDRWMTSPGHRGYLSQTQVATQQEPSVGLTEMDQARAKPPARPSSTPSGDRWTASPRYCDVSSSQASVATQQEPSVGSTATGPMDGKESDSARMVPSPARWTTPSVIRTQQEPSVGLTETACTLPGLRHTSTCSADTGPAAVATVKQSDTTARRICTSPSSPKASLRRNRLQDCARRPGSAGALQRRPRAALSP